MLYRVSANTCTKADWRFLNLGLTFLEPERIDVQESFLFCFCFHITQKRIYPFKPFLGSEFLFLNSISKNTGISQ